MLVFLAGNVTNLAGKVTPCFSLRNVDEIINIFENVDRENGAMLGLGRGPKCHNFPQP